MSGANQIARRSRLRQRARRVVQTLAIAIAILLLLELWTGSETRTYAIIPLSEMMVAMSRLVRQATFLTDVRVTLGIVGISFAIATSAGLIAGTLLGLAPSRIYGAIEPYLIASYASPIFVFYPILVAVLGFGVAPIMVITVTVSIVSIVVNTAIAVKQIKPTYVKLGKTLGMPLLAILLRIGLPSVVPQIFTGLRLGLVYAFLGTITSEFLLARQGIGHFIQLQFQNFEIEPMYGAIVFVALLAIFANAGLAWLENRLYRRQLETV